MGQAWLAAGGKSEMIHAENVWKKFGRHVALRGLTLTVPEGSAYALIGANGAGKTTTIRTMINSIEPTSGSVTIMGVDSRRLSPRELNRIGYVSENQTLPPQLKVADYFDYLRPFYPAWDRDLEAAFRAQLRLPSDRRIGDLSHGMRMKLALACALPYRPKLLILDEPFSGLDPLVRDEFMEGLIAQAGETTLVISTHELGEIEGLATHVAFIEEGEVMFEQSLSDLMDRFREVRVTLDREPSPPPGAPPGWLDVRTAGAAMTFIDSHYSDAELRGSVGTLLAGVRRVETEPMSLRSIFTALARSARESRSK
jgi:ABC-2 type transport system ATP-binding protein